jgi:AcrR family transcriptional regulator
MPRPDTSSLQRKRLIPVIAATFSELGYRRTTTAELARRCDTKEPVLYRLWRDKKAMFLDAVGFVYESSQRTWRGLIRASSSEGGVAQRLLEYEAQHHGEFGLYRIVFAGLSESDDPEISRALARMYRRFHRFLAAQTAAHRKGRGRQALDPAEDLAAWALIGLGTVANVIRELGLATAAERRLLFTGVGRLLLDGRARSPGSHLEGSS